MFSAAAEHRVQFVPLSLCFHLRMAFMRAPGVGSSSAIILQTDRGGGGGGQGQDTDAECVAEGELRQRG